MFADSSIVAAWGMPGRGGGIWTSMPGGGLGRFESMGPKRRERLTWEEWVWWVASCSLPHVSSPPVQRSMKV